jgi:hypothetical protein
MSNSISRRTVLRGIGATLALPWLEAMLPATIAGDGAAKNPLRMAFIYVPNGAHMPDWTPSTTGTSFSLPPILQPLQPVKDHLLVLSGLTLDKARGHGDGGGDHARAMAAFLTGKHPNKTDGADLRAGISVDQLAAERVGKATRFASLEVGCEGGRAAGACDHGYSCAYQTNLSWRDPSVPAAKEIDPSQLFDRLFGPRFGSSQDAGAARRTRAERSILDFVSEDANRLRPRLGGNDRRKLDEYFVSVREVERRLARTEPVAEVGQSRFPRPAGVPADFREHARLLGDLLVLAFQADLTRIVTFVFGNDGSNRCYQEIGVPEGHHDLSHHGGDQVKQAKVRLINTLHVQMLAHLLLRLNSIPDGDGTLLDYCMILYGSGISDGDRHNHEDLPILLAGRANGTIKTGRHLSYPKETPVTNLYLSMLDRIGVEVNAFGDSTGRLRSLEG